MKKIIISVIVASVLASPVFANVQTSEEATGTKNMVQDGDKELKDMTIDELFKEYDDYSRLWFLSIGAGADYMILCQMYLNVVEEELDTRVKYMNAEQKKKYDAIKKRAEKSSKEENKETKKL